MSFMKTKKKKVIVIMPAYNAEKTLRRTYDDIPKGLVDEVILVDDGSHDKTVSIAKKLDIKILYTLKIEDMEETRKHAILLH